MAGYISLLRFTKEGISAVKDPSKHIDQIKAVAAKAGARVVGIWVTMGQYDLVTVVDAPDDQAAAVLVLNLASQGYVTTETMRAFSEDEFRTIVGKLS